MFQRLLIVYSGRLVTHQIWKNAGLLNTVFDEPYVPYRTVSVPYLEIWLTNVVRRRTLLQVRFKKFDGRFVHPYLWRSALAKCMLVIVYESNDLEIERESTNILSGNSNCCSAEILHTS